MSNTKNPIKILLIGSGGREHALAWKMSQSPLCETLFIAPGNPGTAQCGTNVDISPNDFPGLGELCLVKDIGMLVVGPEEPLVKGIADHFENDPALRHIPVIGPKAEAAQLEGSKAFAKAFMQRHSIPTAAYKEFDIESFEEGLEYISKQSYPLVLKADGLAAGKGVLICQNKEEAAREFEAMLKSSKFGTAGARVVVEDFLDGIELSVFALTDGNGYVLLPSSKDYKRIGEGDTGLNTGGMGALSPFPFETPELMKKIDEWVIRPTVEGLREEDIPYKGFIYFGLILVKGEPFVIEYNCRLGDPETEAVLPRLKSDLVELFMLCANDKVTEADVKISEEACGVVILASGGYPGSYEKGKVISGLDSVSGSIVFQAGTANSRSHTTTSGGRVLAVSSLGENIQQALSQSYRSIDQIHFEGMYFRKDIGFDAG